MVIIFIITISKLELKMIKIKNKQTNQILAIFDSLEYIKKHNDFSYLENDYNIDDIKKAQAFLLAGVNFT